MCGAYALFVCLSAAANELRAVRPRFVFFEETDGERGKVVRVGLQPTKLTHMKAPCGVHVPAPLFRLCFHRGYLTVVCVRECTRMLVYCQIPTVLVPSCVYS